MKQKKKGKICFVIYIAGERFFFIYDVIMKQFYYKRSANHYSHSHTHIHTHTHAHSHTHVRVGGMCDVHVCVCE